MSENNSLDATIETLLEQIRQLDDEQLERVQRGTTKEHVRRRTIRNAIEQAREAAKQHQEAVKGDPAHEWSPGAVVGPGERVLEGDTEFVNTSGAWLSVPPSEYPLGYERVEAPADVLEFRAGEQVKAGDLREYKGVVYQVLQPHKTADHWAPDVAVSLWTEA